MNYKDNIIAKIARKACEKTAEKVIENLQNTTKGMQSRNDSPLENVWDEICVQVQGEQSIMWGDYLDTITLFIIKEVEQLDDEIKQVIWLQTKEGFDWECDIEEDKAKDVIPFLEDDIAEYILQEYILQSAADWSNKCIEEYLENGYDYN